MNNRGDLIQCLAPKVQTIFIMLGTGCNFRCRYCLQSGDAAAVRNLPGKINEGIYDFIEGILDSRDGALELRFYGGEPLVHWDNLQRITERFAANGRINFSVITNGSLVTPERAAFLDGHEFNVTVSWDGSASVGTRGHDVFEDAEIRETLLSLERLGVSGVLSAGTSPMHLMDDFQAIDNEYRAIHDYHLRINMDELFDTGLPERGLINADYDRIRSEMAAMADSYFNNLTAPVSEDAFNGKLYCRHILVDNIVNSAKQFVERVRDGIRPRQHFSPCGNGISTLNMDVAGNLYHCHNQFDPIGDTTSGFICYLDRLLDHEQAYTECLDACRDCMAYPVCQGGCRLVGKEARSNSYCAMKRAVYVPVLERFIAFGRA